MKKILFLLLFSLLAFTCEEDDCDSTVADTISFGMLGEITVINQAGLAVEGYPVRITFQKHWCDGGVGFPAEFSGVTDLNGKWSHIIDYELNNEEDYITVDYAAGTGTTQLGHMDLFKYPIINSRVGGGSIGVLFPALHTFEIVE